MTPIREAAALQIHPRIETPHLRLRPFLSEDAPAFAELAGSLDIADTALSIPHPLSPAIARSTIAGNAAGFQAGKSLHFAIEERRSERVVGGVELLHIDDESCQAELVFWIGKPWWGQGYASEAARAVVHLGFADLGLNRIYARHLLRSPVAGAVLRRAAMKQEGVLRDAVRRWDAFEDVALYAVLRADLASAR